MLDGLTSNLERYLDLLAARQKLTAANVANADTPGYQAQDIDFQFEFASLTTGQQPQVIPEQGLKSKSDGNNVDLDREARMLSENAVRFNVASTLLRSQLKMVQTAIQGGGA
jgi:flagellar basal-body rod protein FlgB